MQLDIKLALLYVVGPEELIRYEQLFHGHFSHGNRHTLGSIGHLVLADGQHLKEVVQYLGLLGAGQVDDLLVDRRVAEDLL